MADAPATTPADGTGPDVVILGAGINGAALARELVLNGASVLVVDASDVAFGTTRWSTRLVHGGLRYLEYGEVGLVRESLLERERLVRLAPHLVEPLGFYVPLRGRLGGLRSAAARLVGLDGLARRWASARGRGALVVRMGLALYDLLAIGSAWPRHRIVRAGGAGLPQVDARAFPLAALYADARMALPERFTVELLVDAAAAAAERGLFFRVATRRTARLGEDGRLRLAAGAGEAEESFAPRALVNATGAWVDRTNGALLPGAAPRPLIGGTKGSHLVIDHPPLRAALRTRGIYAEAADGRPVFVLPFGPRLVLVGTTDIPFAGDPASARAEPGEVDYLLAAVAALFPDTAPGAGTVVEHYCGVRPLPATTGRSAAGVTRRHMLVPLPAAPLPAWSIVGGKLTTCRSLAEQGAAIVLRALARRARPVSRDRPLPGACDPRRAESIVAALVALGERAGQAREAAAAAATATVALLGARAASVAALVERAPEAERAALLSPLPGVALPAAVVPWCVAEEWASSLEDVVERRLVLPLDPGFTTATIRAVAAALERCGRLAAADVEGEVTRLVAGLRERHGLRLDPAPPSPSPHDPAPPESRP